MMELRILVHPLTGERTLQFRRTDSNAADYEWRKVPEEIGVLRSAQTDEEKAARATCKGSRYLGTECGHCWKCIDEKARTEEGRADAKDNG